jgi:hypothetical protein
MAGRLCDSHSFDVARIINWRIGWVEYVARVNKI